jgi:hypothetical protein
MGKPYSMDLRERVSCGGRSGWSFLPQGGAQLGVGALVSAWRPRFFEAQVLGADELPHRPIVDLARTG